AEGAEADDGSGARCRVPAPPAAAAGHVVPHRVLPVPVPVALGERRDALHVDRLERAGDGLAREALGVVLERAEVAALIAARVDERLDATELPAGVDAVQREGR